MHSGRDFWRYQRERETQLMDEYYAQFSIARENKQISDKVKDLLKKIRQSSEAKKEDLLK